MISQIIKLTLLITIVTFTVTCKNDSAYQNQELDLANLSQTSQAQHDLVSQIQTLPLQTNIPLTTDTFDIYTTSINRDTVITSVSKNGNEIVLIPDNVYNSASALSYKEEVSLPYKVSFEYATSDDDGGYGYPYIWHSADGVALSFGKDKTTYQNTSLPHGSGRGFISDGTGYGLHFKTYGRREILLTDGHGNILRSFGFRDTYSSGRWVKVEVEIDLSGNVSVFLNSSLAFQEKLADTSDLKTYKSLAFSAATGAADGLHKIRNFQVIKIVDPDAARGQEILNNLNKYVNIDTVEDLYVLKGNPDRDIIVVAAQGGPLPVLSTSCFSFLENAGFTVAYVRQAQMLNKYYQSITEGSPGVLTTTDHVISIEEGQTANIISAVILEKVTRHFQSKGKTIYVISHSLGSFIYPKTLSMFGNHVDKIVIQAGRINIPEEVYRSFQDGFGGVFFTDGQTYIKDPERVDVSESGYTETLPADQVEGDIDIQIDCQWQCIWSGSRVQAGGGINRYSNLLRYIDISNAFYVYGSMDQAVGRLSQEEIDFLEANGARVGKYEDGHSLSTAQEDTIRFLKD